MRIKECGHDHGHEGVGMCHVTRSKVSVLEKFLMFKEALGRQAAVNHFEKQLTSNSQSFVCDHAATATALSWTENDRTLTDILPITKVFNSL